MTMKTKKTLQHIAAVAVVLLTLCLVFAAPVAGAEGTFPAVTDGSTITLQTDYELSQTLVIPEGVTVTIDLSGHYVKFNDTVPGVGIENHGTLTINDSVGTGNVYTTNVSSQSHAAISNYGTLTINAGWFGDADEDMTNANHIQRGTAFQNYGVATINGGHFTAVDNHYNGGYAYAIISGSENIAATLTINYATIYGQPNGLISARGDGEGSLVINDGIFTLVSGTATSYYYFLVYCGGEMNEDFTNTGIVINGGTWTTNTAGNEDFKCDCNNLKITGGTFKTLRTTGQTAGDFFVSNGNTALETTTDGEYTIYTVVDAEAKVDNVGYLTLADAITAANAGDTVTLLKDVTLTETVHIYAGDKVTLDLNGKTIDFNPEVWVYGAANSGTALLTVNFGGDLTITDSSADKSGTIDGSANVNDVYGAVMMTAKGDDAANGTAKLTVNGGTLKGGYAAIAGNKDRDNTEIIINGGKLFADISDTYSTAAIEHPMNGKLTITGGTLEGMDGISLRSGTLLITGGTIIGTAPTSAFEDEGYWDNDFGTCTGHAVQIVSRENSNSANEKPAVSITGGTFTSANTAAIGSYAGYKGATPDTAVTAFITGGTFSSNPSAYIASGYEVVQPGDKYLVQKYVDRSSSSSSSSTTKPEEPEQPEEPVVEPETPTEEPVAGEPTVETEVTDGGEVTFDTPAEPENPDAGEPGDAPSDAPAEPAVTGVVLPEGTDSEVAFIPVSEKPAPAGKEENTKKVFEINVPKYEKGKPATVKFTMTVAELEKDGKTAADVALWHHDEETGEWTKLVTTFVIKDGIVYFEAITFDFSPFAIVYEDTELPTDEPETPEQPTESPAPVLAVLAALGAAVVLRRK